MRFLSVCSGIEAASCAWEPLGWKAHAFAEIEPFPSALLAHRFPDTPNLGDMTRFKEWPDADVDVLVGGTPCQSFSVAGLRMGLDDPRGNLALVYLAILDRYRPRWMVWENVPGVLSSNGGRDFGAFLGGLGQLGYGFSYRVLDAQYCRVGRFRWAVPQRRRRVFVVGYLGDWRRAAAVLFDGASLRGHPPPRREAGQGVTPILEAGARTGVSTTDLRAGSGIGEPGDPMFTLQAGKQHGIAMVAPTVPSRSSAGGGLGTDFDCDGGLVAATVTSKWAKGSGGPAGSETGNLVLQAFGGGVVSGGIDVATTCLASPPRTDFESETFVAHSRRAEGFDASEDGTGRGTPLVPVAFSTEQEPKWSENLSPTLKQPSPTGGGQPTCVSIGQAVRRLTPRECERLQGFPDGWTDIPYRGKPAADGPRYKALGNSMAVNVMSWLGERIALVDALPAMQEAPE